LNDELDVQRHDCRGRAADRATVDIPDPRVELVEKLADSRFRALVVEASQDVLAVLAESEWRRQVRDPLAPDLLTHPPHLVAWLVQAGKRLACSWQVVELPTFSPFSDHLVNPGFPVRAGRLTAGHALTVASDMRPPNWEI
jgi:hypothetical protein